MPDLRTECPPLLPKHIFFKDPDQQFGLLRRAIVHWLDEAVREFNGARDTLLAQISEMKDVEKTTRILYTYDFAHRMDHCLILTRRLLRALDQLRRMPPAQIDRQTRRFIDAQEQKLVGARDVIEHLTEIALGSEWPNHGSLFPRLTDDQLGIEVGGKVVTFAQLASTLRRFHAIAQHLVDTQSGRQHDEQA
jgi:hypothetical protein